MNKYEAIQLITYEAFNENGVIELLASARAPDIERFGLIGDAIECLSKTITTTQIERKLSGALLRIITESSLAFSSWDDEMMDRNYYLTTEWEIIYQKAHEFLMPDIPFDT
jgi:hypothetical protein